MRDLRARLRERERMQQYVRTRDNYTAEYYRRLLAEDERRYGRPDKIPVTYTPVVARNIPVVASKITVTQSPPVLVSKMPVTRSGWRNPPVAVKTEQEILETLQFPIEVKPERSEERQLTPVG